MKTLFTLLTVLCLNYALYAQSPFVSTWKTNNPGKNSDNQITIPTIGEGYFYSIYWGDGYKNEGVTGSITHTYSTPGEYTIAILGNFPRIYFKDTINNEKIISIKQWGDIEWKSMESAFYKCYNLTIDAPDTPDLRQVSNLDYMFYYNRSLNQPLTHWDVSHVTSMKGTFFGASSFNQPINNWDVSQVKIMKNMFYHADNFNQPLNQWQVGNVEDFSYMFRFARNFDQNINNWDISSAKDISHMFDNANEYNQPLNKWDVSHVTDMSYLFHKNFNFNQDLSSWDVSKVVSMDHMFFLAYHFNQDISGWDISNVTTTKLMFRSALKFDQDLSKWNTSKVTDMAGMLYGAESFDQDISSWDVSNVSSMKNMLMGTALSPFNYDNALISWSQQEVQQGVELDASLYYCQSSSARNKLKHNFNWDIIDKGSNCSEEFITTWKTNNSGRSGNKEIFITTKGSGYDYLINWGDGSFDTHVTGNIQHNYNTPGTYSIAISGDFPRLYIQDSGDNEKLLSIDQWGAIKWTSMENAFYECYNLTINATDAPDLSEVTNMDYMFYFNRNLNQPLDHWDVSHVTSMKGLFYGASLFNQPLNSWDVSKVTNMKNMFYHADNFNQPLNNWSLYSAEDLSYMFRFARDFNGDITGWDVSTANNMTHMFDNANKFNQPIGGWDVSNVNDMSYMFHKNFNFNQPIGNWDVSNVKTMDHMFFLAYNFNQDISSWDVSQVTDMKLMFRSTLKFNQDISEWDMSNVTTTEGMFYDAISFNQDLSNWDLSNVTSTKFMFYHAVAFNQDVSQWNVSQVNDMSSMFLEASNFNQSLANWDISNTYDMNNMLDNASLSTENYDATLMGWAQLEVRPDVTLSVSSSYCNAIDAHNKLVNDFGWTINDLGTGCQVIKLPNPTNRLAADNVSENTLTGSILPYPNPVSSILNVNNKEDANIYIKDMHGRSVGETYSGTDVKIDFSNLANGTYFITIQSAKGYQTSKIIKTN